MNGGRRAPGGKIVGMSGQQTTFLKQCLRRLQQGDQAARSDLVETAARRLTRLTRTMLGEFGRLRRWEETDDVLQGALLRLHRAIEQVTPESPRHFYRLATTQIRREMLDLARRYFGPEGHGRNLESALPEKPHPEPADMSLDPTRLAVWSDFHRRVEALPEDELEVFDLIWYQGLLQIEAAEVLGVSARTVMRRWQSACSKLQDCLQMILATS